MEIQSVAVSPQTLTSTPNSQTPVSHEVATGGVAAAQHALQQSAEAHKPVDAKSLQQAVDQANETIQNLSNELQFSVDKGTGEYVVKVVDKQTNEVVRQIPSKEMLEIAKRLDELHGLLIQQKA